MIADLASGKILATTFCAGKTHDLKLFQKSQARIAAKTLCLADSGYQGIVKTHALSQTPRKRSKHHPLTPEQKQANHQLSRRRIVIEHIFGRLKTFKILAERYRNRRRRFALRFNLIAAIYIAAIYIAAIYIAAIYIAAIYIAAIYIAAIYIAAIYNREMTRDF